jgi:hypothetical protein
VNEGFSTLRVIVTPSPIFLLFSLVGVLPVVIFPVLFYQIVVEMFILLSVPLMIVFVTLVVVTLIWMILRHGVGTNSQTAYQQET